MPLSVEMVQAMDASAAGSGRGPHDLRRRRPLLLQVKIQSKLIAMLFVTSAVVSAVLGFIGYESRRTSRRATDPLSPSRLAEASMCDSRGFGGQRWTCKAMSWPLALSS
jgi:hypothetical protein